MPKEIFRTEAMERMASPEQLDELMAVTNPRGWLALAGIGVILTLAIVWGLFGSIETSTRANGVLVRDDGMQRVTAPQDGEVTDVVVQVGESVKAGDALVQLSSNNLVQETKPTSKVAGRVLFLPVVAGDRVRKGDTLIVIELPQRPMQAVLYVSTKAGYQVQPGQTVQVTPATADRYSSRALIGTVQTAGRFPETRSSILRTLQNPDWVNEFLPQGPLLEVIVHFPRKEEMSKLFIGTPCSAEIIMSRKRPIELVFPIFSSP